MQPRRRAHLPATLIFPALLAVAAAQAQPAAAPPGAPAPASEAAGNEASARLHALFEAHRTWREAEYGYA